MNKKIALILACCAATSFAACNETTEWNFTESCNADNTPKRCVESTIQVCKDGVWVPEVTCEGNTPWCDVTTHTCVAKPVAKDCQDGAQKCAENAVWTCKNGKWEKTTDCNEGDKTCNSTTYVCDPKAQPEVTCDHNGIKLAVGATVCSNDTTLQTCTANADGTTASLTPTDCSTSSKVCGNDAENKAACIDAQQPAPTVKCTREGEETEYEVGDKYCGADNTLYTCTLSADGTTATYQSAQCQGNTPVCDNTANDCRAYKDCTLNNAPVAHNALACDGNVSKKCNDGTLEIVKDCAAENPAQVCLATSGECDVAPATACTDAVGTVENGKTICKENNVWTCNNTQLSKTTDCTVTEAEAAAHLVSVCTPGEQGANATCVKKCAEDYKFGEGDNANKCVAAHDQQCKINTVEGKQVAQYRTAESEGGYTEWNNCAKDAISIYGCKENKECDLTGCADTHEIATVDGNKVCVKKKVNNCGNDADGKKAEMDSVYCMSKTQYAMCLSDGQDVYTSTEATNCPDATFTCITSKVNELYGCACTEQTQPACKLVGTGKTPTLYTCDAATGKYNGVACTTTVKYADPTCNTETNACGYECKQNRVVNTDGTACVKCTDPTATSCGEGKYCGADGKCKAVETTACTADVCKTGFINKCEGTAGAKKYSNAVSCIKNGVGTCNADNNACDTTVVSCNVNYMKVEDTEAHIFTCRKYDEVTCTEGVCTDSHYFGCPAAAAGAATRHHSAPVEKPAVDANGTWACNATNGWTLTCTETELYEVKDGKCTLIAGKCKADTDCSGETPKCDVASKTCVAAPATGCTAEAIQCVNETKYKTCTAEGSWSTATTDVATGLKCDTTANKIVCKDDAAKTCNEAKVMGCKDGNLNQVIQDCATNTEGKTTCSAGACVAGGGTTPAAWELLKAFTVKKCDGGACRELLKDIGIYFNSNDINADVDYVSGQNWNNNNSKDTNGVYGNTDSSKSIFVGYRFTSTDGKAVRLSLDIERNNKDKSAKDYQCALYKNGVFKLLSSDTINITTVNVKTPFSCSFNVSALSADDKTDAEIRIIGYNVTGRTQTKFHEAKIEVQK